MSLMLPPTSMTVDNTENESPTANDHPSCATPDPMLLSSPTVSRVARQSPLSDISMQRQNQRNVIQDGTATTPSSSTSAKEVYVRNRTPSRSSTASVSAASVSAAAAATAATETGTESNRRGRWTFKEDQRLRRFVLDYGENWAYISTQMPGRTVLQCQRRWNHVVRYYSSFTDANKMSAHGQPMTSAAVSTTLPLLAKKPVDIEGSLASTARSSGSLLSAAKARVLAGLFRRADEFLASQLVKLRADGATRRRNDSVPIAPSGTLNSLTAAQMQQL
ncbi:hypothetical protein SYNPS1DRAFT_21306, partial [Syncephalis pseudoplumigaleata]